MKNIPMKIISYLVAFLGLISLSYGMYNMPVWVLKAILGILGFIGSILICIGIEEKNTKKNTTKIIKIDVGLHKSNK